ncbi:MAG: polyprenyl synthetase family protein [Acidimicrobiia bacterium]|nr:polyprenyl synthetase family protein [Acidimicrobiia bacterium]
MKAAETLGLDPLAGDMERVEAALRHNISADGRILDDAAGHLVTAGGKRLRPTLTLCSAYAATDGDRPVSDDAVTGAAAVELVHLGSLYHDDVIDEAATRRGVASVNARWSNIVAILAGDFLLARASELAASLGADVAGLLAATIGELCSGQVLELQHLFDIDRTEDSYVSAIEGKTASLMATACRIGGMVTDLDSDDLDAVTEFGRHVGMCFQIVDDVLDLTGTDEALGKPAGQDLTEGIYTLPVIYALRDSERLRSLLGKPLEADDVLTARGIVTSNGSVGFAYDVARSHAKRADEALGQAGALDPTVSAGLRRLVEDLVDRVS